MALSNQALTTTYRSWLIAKGYSSSTVRNYLVDLNKYLSITPADQIFETTTLKTYLSTISDKNLSARNLASLNKFCQFSLDQRIINFHPLKAKSIYTQTEVALPQIVAEFENYLKSKKKTEATIKNYINDLHQFINWANSSENR